MRLHIEGISESRTIKDINRITDECVFWSRRQVDGVPNPFTQKILDLFRQKHSEFEIPDLRLVELWNLHQTKNTLEAGQVAVHRNPRNREVIMDLWADQRQRVMQILAIILPLKTFILENLKADDISLEEGKRLSGHFERRLDTIARSAKMILGVIREEIGKSEE